MKNQKQPKKIVSQYGMKFRSLAFLAFILFYLPNGYTQTCKPSYKGATCEGSILSFYANAPGYDSYIWEWDHDGLTSTDRDPKHAFPRAGTYAVKLRAKDKSGFLPDCIQTLTVFILTAAQPNITLISDQKQCFRSNEFCFIDSTVIPGQKIVRATYLFSDGHLEEYINPQLPLKICYGFQDKRGGGFDLIAEWEGENGCVRKKSYRDLFYVYKNNNPEFSVGTTLTTESTEFEITNHTYLNWLRDPLTTIGLDEMSRFVWDFDDGRTVVGNKDSNTEFWTGKNLDGRFRIQYSGKGTHNPSLTVIDTFGCSTSFTFKNITAAYMIYGNVFNDLNKNCKKDSGEKGVEALVYNNRFYAVSDSNGNYRIPVEDSVPSIIEVVEPRRLSNYKTQGSCKKKYHVLLTKNQHDDTTGYDFPIELDTCPRLYINVESNRRRRCFMNNTFIDLENLGAEIEKDITVNLELPAELDLVKASHPYTKDSNGNYQFEIDAIRPFEKIRIKVTDKVKCLNEVRGRLVCTKAWFSLPRNKCNLNRDSFVAWDKSFLQVRARSVGVKTEFTITNEGSDMADSSTYRVLKFDLTVLEKKFKLDSNKKLVVVVDENNQFTFEVNQTKGYPFGNRNLINVLDSNRFSIIRRSNDPHHGKSVKRNIQYGYDEDCLRIIDSYDPNDKQVQPEGVKSKRGNNIVSSDVAFDYRVRFQNTGTDTAYKVVIKDALDRNLDIKTFEVTGSSHPYSLRFWEENGQTVLYATFENINLPDNKTNELESQGFISYHIDPKPNLEQGTRIQNKADIFFDFNDPIRTNTVWSVIRDELPKADPISVWENDKPLLSFTALRENFCGHFVSPSGKKVWERTGLYWDTLQGVANQDSILEVVLLQSYPNKEIRIARDSLISLHPPGNSSYQWLKCPSFTTLNGETDQELVASQNGNYALEIRYYNCIDTTECHYIEVVGIEEAENSSFKVYPNPTQGKIWIELPDGIQQAKIVIRDLTGKTVLIKQINHKAPKGIDLDVEDGVYILQIEREGNTLGSQRLIKWNSN